MTDWFTVEKIDAQTFVISESGHHQLSIPVSMIDEIETGFAQIEKNGKLKQGNGLFEFEDFQIQI